jgi:hypothetical protein
MLTPQTVMSMKLHPILLLFCLFGAAVSAQAQITIQRDSSDFDEIHGRLREIDFEDVYSVTVDNILFRNPWGLHAMTDELPDAEGNFPDTADVYLWLGQGATLDFPTRTRRVELDGGASAFFVRVTDFNDSSWTLPADTFPRSIVSETGIARLQLLGTDGNGNDDINWRGALVAIATFDENGDTLASSEFQELYPEHYYLIGRGFPSGDFFADESMMMPVEWHGVTFTEPNIGFIGTHLSYFSARVDPDNPIGNLALETTVGSSIDFPEGTEGALLVFENIRERDSLIFEVTDYAGEIDTVLETGWGRTYDTTWAPDQQVTFAHLGFSSAAGIRSIRLIAAWSTLIEPNESGADTLVYEATAMLAALHLAEAVPSEIAGISAVVVELDTTGYVAPEESTMLRTTLATAGSSASKGDRPRAIEALNTFRAQVNRLHQNDRLVDEEARLFLEDAAYVISRLGGTSSVETGRGSASGFALDAPIVGESAVAMRYRAGSGVVPTLHIVDMSGARVRTIEAREGDGTIYWDRRNDAGAPVSSGVYVAVLAANGATVSRVIHITR